MQREIRPCVLNLVFAGASLAEAIRSGLSIEPSDFRLEIWRNACFSARTRLPFGIYEVEELLAAGEYMCSCLPFTVEKARALQRWENAVELVKKKLAGASPGATDDLQGLDVTELQSAINVTLAPTLLIEAADAIENRASERDKPDGERSMRCAVDTFNALTGQQLSEREGWIFMVALKLARAQGGTHTRDDYVDGAAYMALACESVEQA